MKQLSFYLSTYLITIFSIKLLDNFNNFIESKSDKGCMNELILIIDWKYFQDILKSSIVNSKIMNTHESPQRLHLSCCLCITVTIPTITRPFSCSNSGLSLYPHQVIRARFRLSSRRSPHVLWFWDALNRHVLQLISVTT